jgi:predicted DNA-binding ribbon-helix-helix protein
MPEVSEPSLLLTLRWREMDSNRRSPAEFGSNIVPRALVVCGRRTTLRLEPDLWAALDEMTVRERAPSLSRLVSGIVEDGHGSMGSATSAVRAAIVRYYRAAADEAAANGAAPAARPALPTPLAKSTYG